MFRCTGYRIFHRRIDFLQKRKDTQADKIPRIGIGKISAISHIPQTASGKPFQNILTAHGKQGTHHKTIFRTNPTQTSDTGSAYQIHQKRFHTVVTMMSYRNSLRSSRDPLFFKPVIAQLAGSHFNGKTTAGRIFPGIEVRHQERDIQFSGILSYKLFVTQGFVSPQMKITMRHSTGIARLHQNGE